MGLVKLLTFDMYDTCSCRYNASFLPGGAGIRVVGFIKPYLSHRAADQVPGLPAP